MRRNGRRKKCLEVEAREETYLRPVRSLPIRLMTATLKTKLEKIVNTPAIPEIIKVAIDLPVFPNCYGKWKKSG